MPNPIVEAFLIDDANEDKFWDHGLTVAHVAQVLDGPHRIKRNRRDRRASHLLIGRDHQGRCIAIPIEPTHERGVWRPITAWLCKKHEVAWLPWVWKSEGVSVMDEVELKELQDPESWGDEEGEMRPPVKSSRAIVSVAFSRDDFQRVAECAQGHGTKTSEFIRNAVLEKVAKRNAPGAVVSVSGNVRTVYPAIRPKDAWIILKITPVARGYSTA